MHIQASGFKLLLTTFLYFMVVGGIYLAVFSGFFVTFALAYRGKMSKAWQSASRVGIFLILLLFYGAIGQIIWNSAVFGKLYYSTDYVFGYLPFYPITQAEINAEFAGERGALLNGSSLWTVNSVWSIITACVWITATLSYYAIRSKKPA